MPLKRANLPSLPRRGAVGSSPPPVMTWGRAIPILTVAGIFDLVRAFFEFFWFLGPALAALLCTVKAADTFSSLSFGLLGLKAAGVACTAAAGAIGVAGTEVITPFGVVMAMSIGFLGWLTVGGWILFTNSRMIRENAVSFASGLAVSEAPFLGALPALTGTVWRMYRNQIKTERAAYAQWEKEQAALRLQQQQQQIAYLQALQSSQQAAVLQEQLQQEAIDAVQYQNMEAANDAAYIPEQIEKAA